MSFPWQAYGVSEPGCRLHPPAGGHVCEQRVEAQREDTREPQAGGSPSRWGRELADRACSLPGRGGRSRNPEFSLRLP